MAEPVLLPVKQGSLVHKNRSSWRCCCCRTDGALYWRVSRAQLSFTFTILSDWPSRAIFHTALKGVGCARSSHE